MTTKTVLRLLLNSHWEGKVPPGKSHWSILRPGTGFVMIQMVPMSSSLTVSWRCWGKHSHLSALAPSVTRHSSHWYRQDLVMCMPPAHPIQETACWATQPCLSSHAQHCSGQRRLCLFSQFPLWMEDPTYRVLPPPQTGFLGIPPRNAAFSHPGRVKHSLPSRMRADAL